MWVSCLVSCFVSLYVQCCQSLVTTSVHHISTALRIFFHHFTWTNYASVTVVFSCCFVTILRAVIEFVSRHICVGVVSITMPQPDVCVSWRHSIGYQRFRVVRILVEEFLAELRQTNYKNEVRWTRLQLFWSCVTKLSTTSPSNHSIFKRHLKSFLFTDSFF